MKNLSYTKRHGKLRTIALVLVLGAWLQSPVFADSLTLGQNNEILSGYLEGQVTQTSGYNGWDHFGGRLNPTDIAFLNRRVEALTNRFMDQLTGRLKGLKRSLHDASMIGRQFSSLSVDSSSKLRILKLWRESFEEMEDKAGDLRGMLSPVAAGLASKCGYRPLVESSAMDSGYAKEIEFLRVEAGKAEKRITDYFLAPKHTVDVMDLRGENMLIHLHRVQKMAKELSKRLKSEYKKET